MLSGRGGGGGGGGGQFARNNVFADKSARISMVF